VCERLEGKDRGRVRVRMAVGMQVDGRVRVGKGVEVELVMRVEGGMVMRNG